jgi:PAS domain S-box-containing protein
MSEDDVDIHVIDNGPGLPQQEREVLREGSESPLIHGSGLGLWLTYWIVSNHDGSIQTDVDDEGTRVTVTLPKTSGLSQFADSETLLGRFHREQDKFEAVFEGSFDAIVLFDDDGRFTDVNEAAADLFGVSKEKLRGRPIKAFLPDEFAVKDAWHSFQEKGRERDKIALSLPNGTTRITEYTAVTDIIPGQHLAILRDLTDRSEPERRPPALS